MATEEDIKHINEAIEGYFSEKSQVDFIPAKKLMPALVDCGLFVKDVRNGSPLRELLRRLDQEGRLGDISRLYYVRKGKDTYWYFLREGANPPELEVDRIPEKEQRKKRLLKKQEGDLDYVLDTCDRVLRHESLRKHTFDWLVGDLHRNGRTRSKLPCDAYYGKLKLVVEYVLPPLTQRIGDEDIRPGSEDRRAERDALREKYAERKRDYLAKNDLALVELRPELFELNEKGLISRDRVRDTKIIGAALAEHIKE